MWWSRPLPVLAVLAALLAPGLSGCGFHPLYGHGGGPSDSGVAAKMAAIRVTTIDDRVGQKLRNELTSRLNPRGEPVVPKYVLTVKLRQYSAGLAHTSDGTATLAELTMNANFVLTAVAGSNGGTAGSVQTVVGSDFLGPRYASVAAEGDAEDRAVAQIADRLVNEIAIYLNNPASRPPLETLPAPGATIQHYQLLQGLPPQAAPPVSAPAAVGAEAGAAR